MATARSSSPIIRKNKTELCSTTAMKLIALSRILARQAAREEISAQAKINVNRTNEESDDAS